MKKLLFLAFAAIVFSSCENKEVKKLSNTKDSLANVVAEKDSIINNAFLDIDEIASSLNMIAERENLVTKQSAENEISKTKKQEIADNIVSISNLLDQNREALARLNATTKKLSAANVEVSGLKKLISSLKKQIEDKDIEIANLTKKINEMHSEIETLVANVEQLQGAKTNLETTVNEQTTKIETQTNQINTVYYVVGKEKDLMTKNIIDKKGFIGRTVVVGSNTVSNSFIKTDLRNLERLPVAQKRITIVTSHPSDSYMLVEGAGGVVDEIVITDKDRFWANSKILIVSYK